ncbi:hypothetical protein YPPY94_3009 [Yersinia pestis PY-94]|nr:hypothetical protein YPPY12_3138 [Yersinia pestis PY-12]EIR76320.1 hypothetical protein YPPY32_3273 [Yersinia pestis PY-32]EIS43853.1 hypothetical protein YPPY59_3046 [Yersinia pestis PY-59]EIT14994.1 hypothetical protein YPPY94_3009 [Yersinia pestis PY-94]EIT54836.1 hypothetical protein YPPY102_3008 [Yersinia pestis PY-102]
MSTMEITKKREKVKNLFFLANIQHRKPPFLAFTVPPLGV